MTSPKVKPYRLDHIKRIDKTGQMVWSQVSIKIVGKHYGNYVLDNSKWDKISHSLTKN